MKRIIIGIAFTMLFAFEAQAGCKMISEGIFNCDGFEIQVSGNMSGNILKVRGRVSGGKNCSSLKIYADLKSKSGQRERVDFTVTNIGPGRSDVIREDIEISKWQRKPSEYYHPENIEIYCNK
jgi:hypothetical protein